MSNQLPAHLEVDINETKCVDCEMSFLDLANILDSTICHDRVSKTMYAIQCLLNYTEEDQINTGASGRASTGKSFVAKEVLAYFPDEDIIPYGYASPKKFYHEKGDLCRMDTLEPMPTRSEYIQQKYEFWRIENTPPDRYSGLSEWKEKAKDEKRRLREEWNAIDKVILVDLHQKVIVFLDQPNDELLKTLRPLLSKDKKEILISIVDAGASGGHRNKNVLIRGYPSIIFLSTSYSMNEQEITRLVLLSPDVTQTKIRESIGADADFMRDRKTFRGELMRDMNRRRLMERFKQIIEQKENTRQVIISTEDMHELKTTFLRERTILRPRHMRDFKILVAIVKASTILNYFTRDKQEGAVYANKNDIDEGLNFYGLISPSNELGINPEIYKLYTERIKPILNAGGTLTRRELAREYYKLYNIRSGKRLIKKIVEILTEVGLAIEQQDPENRRQLVIISPDTAEEREPAQTNLNI